MDEISRPMKIMISSLAVTITHWPAIENRISAWYSPVSAFFASEETVRGKHRQDADADHQHAEECGEAVHHQHAAERRTGDSVRVDRAAAAPPPAPRG